MIQDPGGVASVGTAVPPTAAVWAFSLGIDQHWPLIVFGLLVGLLAKAGAQLAAARPFGWRELRIEALLSAITFLVAGFMVQTWVRTMGPPPPFLVLIFSAGLMLGNARLLPIIERISLGSASKALGHTGSTSHVVLPPATQGPEASEIMRRLDGEAGHD